MVMEYNEKYVTDKVNYTQINNKYQNKKISSMISVVLGLKSFLYRYADAIVGNPAPTEH
jgi:hypothetical protein